MSHIPAIAARNIARSPAAFLQRPVGRRWIDDLASAYPHEAFPRDYHAPLGDERCNAIASRLLAAKRGNIPLTEALAEKFNPSGKTRRPIETKAPRSISSPAMTPAKSSTH